MTRTLIMTETPGWYTDPEQLDKKTRVKPGDIVVTREEWEAAKKTADVASTRITPFGDHQVRVLDTGKVAVGPTKKIKCVDCGKEREIKVQDAFQVLRCVEHQKAHRLAKRRERTRQRRSTK